MSRRRGRRSNRRRGGRQVTQQATLTLSEAVRRFDELMERERESIRTPDAYVRSSWVYGAISLIAGAVSNAPLYVYASGKEPVDCELSRFIDRPNPYDSQGTSAKFRYAYLTELLLNGAVLRLFPQTDGFRPLAMVVLPRWRCTVQEIVDDAGFRVPVRWQFYGRGGVKTYITGDDVYHDALYNPYHEWEGLSPLQAAIGTLNNDVDSVEFCHRYFKNDSSTGLVFTSEHPAFNQDAADAAKQKWDEAHAGVRNAFGAKFVGYGLKPTNVGSPFDADTHRALKNLTKEEIVTGIFKIPLEVFGAERPTEGVQIGDRQADTAQEAFLVNVVMPWAKRHDEEFNRDVTWRFGSQYRVAHDFESHPLLEKRRLERARAAAELIDRGIPINDVIRWMKLQLEPTPWGSEWWVPDNMIPASVIQKAGERALFDRRSSPSNAGEKNGKPGVRDKRGHPARDGQDVLAEYVRSIIEHSKTAAVRNGLNGTNGHTAGGRLAGILQGVAG